MYYLLITILIGAFLGLLALNVYFRIKVLKVYKRLVQGRVDFDVKQLLDLKRLREEVTPKYPKHVDDIMLFAGYIRRSVQLGVMLISIIVMAATVLYFFR